MPMAEWISRNERLPTAKDADLQNCVIVWHLYNGVMVTGYRFAAENKLNTHWMRCMEAPKDFPEEYQAKMNRRKG